MNAASAVRRAQSSERMSAAQSGERGSAAQCSATNLIEPHHIDTTTVANTPTPLSPSAPLRSDFFPVILNFLRQLPVIGPILSAPGIANVLDKLAGSRTSAV